MRFSNLAVALAASMTTLAMSHHLEAAEKLLIDTGVVDLPTPAYHDEYHHYWMVERFNWKSPIDWTRGNYYVRYELIARPNSGKKWRMQMCREFPGWYGDRGYFIKELSERGVYTKTTRPSIKYPDDPMQYRFFLANQFEGTWKNIPYSNADFYPMKVRCICVLVSPGATFSGWENYTTAYTVHFGNLQHQKGDGNEAYKVKYMGAALHFDQGTLGTSKSLTGELDLTGLNPQSEVTLTLIASGVEAGEMGLEFNGKPVPVPSAMIGGGQQMWVQGAVPLSFSQLRPGINSITFKYLSRKTLIDYVDTRPQNYTHKIQNEAFRIDTAYIRVRPGGDTGASIRLTLPRTGELWRIGSSQEIAWTSEGRTQQVNIELSRDGGSSWETIAAATPNNGSLFWTVTGQPSASALLRISDSADPAVSTTSPGSFVIQDADEVPPAVALTALGVGGLVDDPSTTTVLLGGSSYPVTRGAFAGETKRITTGDSITLAAADAGGNRATRRLQVGP